MDRPACLAGFQAQSQGEVEGSGQGRSSGPHPRGKLRGLAWGGSPVPHLAGGGSRPTPLGVSRPTPRGVSRPTPMGRSPGPHPGGLPGPTPGGRVCIPVCTEAHPPVTATTVGGTHPTGMHSCYQRDQRPP